MEGNIHVGWIVFGIWFAGFWVTRLIIGLGNPFAKTIDEDESALSFVWPFVWLMGCVVWVVDTMVDIWQAVRKKWRNGNHNGFFRVINAVMRFILKTIYYCTLPLRPFALGREISGSLKVRKLRKEQRRSKWNPATTCNCETS